MHHCDRPKYLQGFHLGFDHWYSTDSPENVALSQDIYRRLKAAGLIYVKPVEQFYDPVKGMFLADRYIKGRVPQLPREKISTPTHANLQHRQFTRRSDRSVTRRYRAPSRC